MTSYEAIMVSSTWKHGTEIFVGQLDRLKDGVSKWMLTSQGEIFTTLLLMLIDVSSTVNPTIMFESTAVVHSDCNLVCDAVICPAILPRYWSLQLLGILLGALYCTV